MVLGSIGTLLAGSGVGAAQPGTGNGNGDSNQPSKLVFSDQETDGTLVTVKQAFLPEAGYVSIHDARTRLFDDEPANVRVLKSLIGITELLEPGRYRNVEVPLFTSAAPAVAQFGRSGPLEESQPLISIPHVNDESTGDEFSLRLPDDDETAFLVGDGSFTGINKLGELGATNDIATVFVDGADKAERKAARDETSDIRAEFSS